MALHSTALDSVFLQLAVAEPSPLAPEPGELIVGLIAFVLLFLLLRAKVWPVFEKTFADRAAAIEGGMADLACGSTSHNAECRQKVAFAVPHHITGARYLVRADSPIAELSDFGNKKLASTKGTTPLAAIISASRDRLIG